ncbi:hypothetical protein BGZ46_005480 [Entomortierella lignicola]|nr:hypothetical protein BGZ46_005480 [Entomortierella lignicola]
MTKAVRHLAGPDNTTMGEMIDNTDRQSIYRVMLEERAFKSWFAGRTVLIGDACHKSVPFIGKGASESILDAVVLASLLYDMPSSRADPSTPSFKSYNNLQKIFRKYYHARADFAKQAVNMSGFFTSILVKEGWTGHVIRKVVFKMNTGWIGRVQLDRVYYQRIQASFLPQVPDHGSAPCRPHVVSKRPVVGLVDYYGSRHGSRDGDHDGYGDDEQEEEGEYDDLSTIDRTSSIAGRSVKSTALSKYRMGGGEDRVLDHARVDEFLTGIDQNPIAI